MSRGAVLITGASTGIGRAAALRLVQAGWRVYAGVRREEDAGALERAAASDRLVPVFLDVTDPDQIAATAGIIRADTGDAGLAGLVNNAGIAIGAPIEFLPLAELRRQFDVNVMGMVAVTQAVLPPLRLARGRVVNVGSIAGRSALPLLGAYSASKFAVEALSDSLRLEMRPWAIDVIVIEPGAVRTRIWERSIATADRMMEHMPERVLEYYGALMRVVRKRSERSAEVGIPADRVAVVIERALTATRPRTRYLVGRDARIRALLQKLPDRWRDNIIANKLEPRDETRDKGATP